MNVLKIQKKTKDSAFQMSFVIYNKISDYIKKAAEKGLYHTLIRFSDLGYDIMMNHEFKDHPINISCQEFISEGFEVIPQSLCGCFNSLMISWQEENKKEPAFENYDSKYKFRWLLEMDGVDAFNVKKFQRPKFFNGDWSPVECVLYDPVVSDCAQRVLKWLKSGERKDVVLKHLNGETTVVETWILKNCYVVATDFGNLDYSAKDSLEILITLKHEGLAIQQSSIVGQDE